MNAGSYRTSDAFASAEAIARLSARVRALPARPSVSPFRLGPPSIREAPTARWTFDADEDTFVGPPSIGRIPAPPPVANIRPAIAAPRPLAVVVSRDETIRRFVRGFFFGLGGFVIGFVIASFLAALFASGLSVASILVLLAFLVAVPSLAINAALRVRIERRNTSARHPTFYAPGPFGGPKAVLSERMRR